MGQGSALKYALLAVLLSFFLLVPDSSFADASADRNEWCPIMRKTNNPGRRRAYLFCLLIGAALIGVVGFLGGSLIYGIDHLMW